MRTTMRDIRRANADAGLHFFDPGTMRFFRSRIGSDVFEGPGGIYFVSSEQFRPGYPRKYTVRRFDPADGSVETVGDFQAYGALRAAKAKARALSEVR